MADISCPSSAPHDRVIVTHDGNVTVRPGRTEVRRRVRGDVAVCPGGTLVVGRSAVVAGKVHLHADASAEIHGKVSELIVDTGAYADVHGVISGDVHNLPGSVVLITGTVQGRLTAGSEQPGTHVSPVAMRPPETSLEPLADAKGRAAEAPLVRLNVRTLRGKTAHRRLNSYLALTYFPMPNVVDLSAHQLEQLAVLYSTTPIALLATLRRDRIID